MRPLIRAVWRSTGTDTWPEAYGLARWAAIDSAEAVGRVLASAEGPRAEEARQAFSRPTPPESGYGLTIQGQRELNKSLGSYVLRMRRALALVVRPDTKDSLAQIMLDEAKINESDAPSLSLAMGDFGADVGRSLRLVATIAGAALIFSILRSK